MRPVVVLAWAEVGEPTVLTPASALQAGAHAALHPLQAPLCPRVCRFLHLFWTDRLRWDQG